MPGIVPRTYIPERGSLMDSDSTDTNTHDELMQLPEEITIAQRTVGELSTSSGINAASETENMSAFVSGSTSLTSSRPSHADDLETSILWSP
jgi:hypothetical protein